MSFCSVCRSARVDGVSVAVHPCFGHCLLYDTRGTIACGVDRVLHRRALPVASERRRGPASAVASMAAGKAGFSAIVDGIARDLRTYTHAYTNTMLF